MGGKQYLVARVSDTYLLYQYDPSLAAAVIATVVFAVLSTLHAFRLVKARMWFCIPFFIGGLFEMIGYIGRALGHSNRQALSPYIMQSLLILVAPALFAATLYMTLSRLVLATHSEGQSPIRPTWLTKLFVTADVLTFFVQGGGGGIQASANDDPSKLKLGENVVLAGLALQVLIFSIFVTVSVVLHLRLRANPTPQSMSSEIGWKRMFFTLYVCSGLILARNIVRIAEYALGREGYLLSHEWTTYVFDALVMAIMMLIFLVGYPTIIRPEREDVELAPQKFGFAATTHQYSEHRVKEMER